MPIKPIRVGLLGPYGHGNLGDAAIQQAMVENMALSMPEVRCIGISLNPKDTLIRHGMEAFPAAVTPVTNYLSPEYPTPEPDRSELGPGKPAVSKISLTEFAKKPLKSIPFVHTFVKFARDALLVLSGELLHTLRVAKFTRSLDVLIISGGGQVGDLWGGIWGHPFALYKFTLMARLTRTPILFISVGTGSLRFRASRYLLRQSLKRALYRSYRDGFSREEAIQRLDAPKSDRVVPDLAFSLPISQWMKPPRPAGVDLIVGICPIAYADPRVWPEPSEVKYRDYVRRLAELCLWILSQGKRLIFLATDTCDEETSKDVLAEMRLESGPFKEKVEVFVSRTVNSYVEGVSRVDLLVVSRLHGIILAHNLQKPVLSISYSRKVNTHMEEFGESQYLLDIDTFQLAEASRLFLALEKERLGVPARLEKKLLENQSLLNAQYRFLFGMLERAGGSESR